MSRRKLTPEEVTWLLTDLPVPKIFLPGVREHIKTILEASFQKQLSKLLIFPELLGEIKKLLQECFLKSFTPTGESIGILAAQSIEGFTQNTMNMFHFAGLSEKNMTLGLPRYEEILNATDNPKVVSFTFYPKKTYKTPEQLRNNIKLTEVLIENISGRSVVSPTRGENACPEEKWYVTYQSLFSSEFRKCDWRVRLYFNIGKLFRTSLTLFDVAREIERQLDTLFVVPSPMSHSGDDLFLDIFVDTANIEGDSQEGETHENYIRKIVIPTLNGLVVSGVKGVEAVYLKDTGSGWIYEGNGGKLIDLLCHPQSDSTRTFSDQMWDVHQCLGVEAAREFLIEEIIKIMSFDGAYVNPKHIMLMVDMMTIDGTIYAVNRYDMFKADPKPLNKAGFEETVENLIRSGIRGEVDEMNSVNAAVYCGKAPPIGGSKCDILIDLSKLETVEEETAEMVAF